MNRPILVILGAALLLSVWPFYSCKRADPAALTMELLPVPDNPLVSVRILVKIGSANDPSDKEGLCRLTWSLLANGGSRTHTIDEITRAFYPLAAGLSLSMDKEMAVFSGTVHRDNLERYYGILRDMLLDPGFREDDFNRLKTDQLDFVDKSLVGTMDEALGQEILNLMMYDGHPYGHDEAGTAESAAGMALDEAKDFYHEHFVRGNIIIGLAGGYPADFPKRVEADFNTLPAGFTPRIILPAPRKPKGLEFVLAEKQTRATAISLGFPVRLTKADKDFFALWIAGAHFGEHRQSLSRLYQKIREERGQNYGDYAYIEHFVQGRDKFPAPNHSRQQQYFSIWIRPVNNANRHFVIRQALRELKKLVEEGISEERFELVRTYLLNYTKLYPQTLGERLGWQMESHYYGRDDFLAEARKALPKLSLADVNAAIRKYLDPDNVLVAVVTRDAEALKAALASNAPSPVRYANPNMPKEVLDEDRIIQAYALDVKPEAVRIAPAAEFFQKRGLPAR
ncbi:MAG: pitrilysin family protein [Candidatus Aminicenantales bacterium]